MGLFSRVAIAKLALIIQKVVLKPIFYSEKLHAETDRRHQPIS